MIEFSKEFKRVVVSHLLTHKDSAMSGEPQKKPKDDPNDEQND